MGGLPRDLPNFPLYDPCADPGYGDAIRGAVQLVEVVWFVEYPFLVHVIKVEFSKKNDRQKKEKRKKKMKRSLDPLAAFDGSGSGSSSSDEDGSGSSSGSASAAKKKSKAPEPKPVEEPKKKEISINDLKKHGYRDAKVSALFFLAITSITGSMDARKTNSRFLHSIDFNQTSKCNLLLLAASIFHLCLFFFFFLSLS